MTGNILPRAQLQHFSSLFFSSLFLPRVLLPPLLLLPFDADS
jgi:hypothetical protein